MFIYKITNKLNGKIYIGQTRQAIEKRFMQHAAAKTPLGHAMQDCGLENFTIEVVEECETKEQANDREQFWIKVLKCKSPAGYNQCDGGAGVIGCTSPRHYQVKYAVPFKSGKMTIGESFKRLRKDFNLTQSSVAEKLGILQQSYYKYETDKVKPSAEVVRDLAVAYDVSADYLLGLSDEPRPIKFDEEEVKEAFALRDALKKVMSKGA